MQKLMGVISVFIFAVTTIITTSPCEIALPTLFGETVMFVNPFCKIETLAIFAQRANAAQITSAKSTTQPTETNQTATPKAKPATVQPGVRPTVNSTSTQTVVTPQPPIQPGYDYNQPPGSDWEWRGPKDSGAWYNPKTNEYLRKDDKNPSHDAHYDWRTPDGSCYRIYLDGRLEKKEC